MIVIIGKTKEERENFFLEFVKKKNLQKNEILFLSETDSTLENIINSLSSSFFYEKPKIVVARFFLEKNNNQDLKKILNLENDYGTTVVLEEESILSEWKKFFEKEKIEVFLAKEKEKIKTSDIFEIANAISSMDKKRIWLSYQNLLKDESPEAIFGVILWKVRQMAEKTKDKKYISWYKKLLDAQLISRTSKIPFELSLEKTLIELK